MESPSDREAFGQRLREAIERSPLSQKELAAQLRISENTLSNYATGKRVPDALLAGVIARSLDVDALWLLTGLGELHGGPIVLPAQGGGEFQGIPVVGRIAAGRLIAQYAAEHADDFIPLDPAQIIRGEGDLLFGLRITGDSMWPWMIEGDVAICSAFQIPDVGDDVCFYQYKTGESTIKRLDAMNRKSGQARLRPLNPLYDTFIVNMTHEDQLKRVVGVWRDYRFIRKRPGRMD